MSKKKGQTGDEGFVEEPVSEPVEEILEHPEDKPDTESLETELKNEKDRYLRLFAEYDNFRKRSQKERENIYADVRADTVLRFLPVYDNLSRALQQDTVDEAYRKGVEMTRNQMKEIMEKLGVREIEAVGKTFDPELHNAVLHVEDESHGQNQIIEEFEKGFKIGDKVIRFSMVKVAN
jgi:molecular chaperone GrpE